MDIRTKKTADGRDFLTINPKGYVAALELDDGRVLTEGALIVRYLADPRPEQGLASPAATWERVRLRERFKFVTCEFHAGLAPLFNRALAETAGGYLAERPHRRPDYPQPTPAVRAAPRGKPLRSQRRRARDKGVFVLPGVALGKNDWMAWVGVGTLPGFGQKKQGK
ncbi:glutathione S-transferase [Alcanivorax xiamenensis]|uniref:Glutathione S-transferase n=1 Tax=Alcanivorax xiamenensis TaxID=1177156 RepID=A0ABQ6Y7W4_9GAMM|nr:MULTISPECIES: hypothetical protein [Alcanivoracaceae]KAF0805473.1 glutathione S-transferase [Alcanivorax xiamenensis]WOA29595.1 hypothetical protein RVY87_11945 [Alloalcanivorax xenomutans]